MDGNIHFHTCRTCDHDEALPGLYCQNDCEFNGDCWECESKAA